MKGFKEFLMRGNLIELAVAVIMGTAFNSVVKSFTDLLLDILGRIGGRPDFSSVSIAGIALGAFLSSLFAFVLTATVVYFGIVLPYNKMASLRKKDEPEAAASSEDLLGEIRDLLKEQNARAGGKRQPTADLIAIPRPLPISAPVVRRHLPEQRLLGGVGRPTAQRFVAAGPPARGADGARSARRRTGPARGPFGDQSGTTRGQGTSLARRATAIVSISPVRPPGNSLSRSSTSAARSGFALCAEGRVDLVRAVRTRAPDATDAARQPTQTGRRAPCEAFSQAPCAPRGVRHLSAATE